MSGKIKRPAWWLPAVLILAFLPVKGITAGRVIVETGDAPALGEFASTHELDLEPFIGYPEPSQEVRRAFGDYYLLTLPRGAEHLLDSLAALSGVRFAEEDQTHHIPYHPSISGLPPADTFYQPYTPDDPLFSEQWDKIKTRTNWGWNLTRGSPEVMIAVLDTGADTDHEDLVDNLMEGYNFVSETTDVEDDYGHGTHVSGIAAARMDNGKGIAGMAGRCRIMPVKVADGGGRYTEADLAQGIIYAADNEATVINMSLGWEYPSTVVGNAVAYAWEKGAFLCASAGNNNEEMSKYPGAYPEVMSVGATTRGDSRWRYSNYGDQVAIFAPGQDIYSCLFYGTYGSHEGTSMASPQVAGLAALLYSHDSSYTNQEVWERMVETADTIPVSLDLRINTAKALGVVVGITERPGSSALRVQAIHEGRLRFNFQDTLPRGCMLRLFDASGRLIHTSPVNPADGLMELDALPCTGVYFWEITTGQGPTRGKLIYLN